MPHAIVLEENEGEAAVVLWQMLQDVTLWGAMPPEKRGSELFNDEAGEMGDFLPELRLDLGTLSVLVRDNHPDAAPIIASVCYRIANWAEAQGHTGTALCFVQAAALIDRENPRYAQGVAKLARRRADYARASVWFRRAVVLARRAGIWDVEARSYAGLGILYWQLGNLPQALEFEERAIRIARRYSLHEARADALFNLAALKFEMNQPAAGLSAAQLALRAYGPGHLRIPALAQNLALAWMDCLGAYKQALTILKELPHLACWRPGERITVISSLARAAGGVGDHDLFGTAWAEAWAWLEDERDHEVSARVLLSLGRGAYLLGDVERAELATTHCLGVSKARQEGQVRLIAETLLTDVQGENTLDRTEQPAIEAPSEVIDSRQRAVELFLEALQHCEQLSDEVAAARAAVFANPGSPTPAYQLAMLYRRRAEYSNASSWLERASYLAERSGNWEVAARSLSSLGNIHYKRGDVTGAAARHEQARKLAHRHNLREIEGEALCDLCVVNYEMGNGSEGFALAREAISVYGPGHPKIARVAHDAAVFMMQVRGDYQNAFTVFSELVNHILRPPDQLATFANLARAAAGAGEMLAFEKAWDEARTLIRRMGADQENHAAAMLNLAYGAFAAGRIDWAEHATTRAHGLALARGETYAIPDAEALLEKIASAKKTRVRPRPYVDPKHDPKEAGELARELLRALQARVVSQRKPRAPAKPRADR